MDPPPLNYSHSAGSTIHSSSSSARHIMSPRNGALSLATAAETFPSNEVTRVHPEGDYMYPLPPPRPSPYGISYVGGSTNGHGKGKEKEKEQDLEDIFMDLDESDEEDDGEGVMKGKGKGKEVVRNEFGKRQDKSDREMMPVKREEFVRVVLQALRDVGYAQTAQTLEQESGYILQPPLISLLAAAILGGRWSESIALLQELGVITEADVHAAGRGSGAGALGRRSLPDIAEIIGGRGEILAGVQGELSQSVPAGEGGLSTVGSMESISHLNGVLKGDSNGLASQGSQKGREALFRILQQKYLELLELGQTKRALTVLRGELAPLVKARSGGLSNGNGPAGKDEESDMGSERLHALSGFMMCFDRNDLFERAKWDGAAGRSREILLKELQDSIAPGIMIPPRRLETLFNQAFRHQQLQCLYHTDSSLTSMSLLSDHRCTRGQFPTVTTHVLAEHTDEVWVIEWSASGEYLASAGVDREIIIWKIGPAPERICSKHLKLSGHADPVQVLAWSHDDTRLLSCAENVIYLWDTKDGRLVHSIPSIHTDSITAAKWLPNDSGFISSSLEMKIIFWTREGTLRTSWNTVPLRVLDFVITPDGKRLIAIAVYNDSKSDAHGALKPAASRTPDPAAMASLQSNGNGSGYPIGRMDRQLVIYNMDNGKIQARRAIPSELTSIRLSNDMKQVVINCQPDEIQLWSIEHDVLHFIRKFTGHHHRQYHLRSCFGGSARNFVMSGSEDSNIYVWHRDTAAMLEVLEGHDRNVNSVVWNPVESAMFASCSDDSTVRIWQSPSAAEAMSKLSSSTDVSATGNWAPSISPTSPLALDMGSMDMIF